VLINSIITSFCYLELQFIVVKRSMESSHSKGGAAPPCLLRQPMAVVTNLNRLDGWHRLTTKPFLWQLETAASTRKDDAYCPT